jgi:hypothetical protein
MYRYRTDRRLTGRYKMKTPLRVRLWKSAVPECSAESVNLSQHGIYFATNSELLTGLNDDSLALKLVQGGAQDFLAKVDVSRNNLTRAILYAVERERLEHHVGID